MKTIAVLIDFTEGSVVAIHKALNLAEAIQGSVIGVHIVNSPDKVKKAQTDLDEFIQRHNTTGTAMTGVITIGSLVDGSQEAFRKINPDLVMVCTHGIVGVKQHLFGAQILKLVQGVNYPSFVIRSNSELDFAKIDNIMMPIGPHPEFMLKIKQTGDLAKLLNASVLIYRINRPGLEFEDILVKNESNAVKYFESEKIKYNLVLEDLKVMSVGYSRQTLEYAKEHQIGLISLMANVSRNDSLFGYGDKESFLVNESGVAVLVCN